jgi:hypothetical protein
MVAIGILEAGNHWCSTFGDSDRMYWDVIFHLRRVLLHPNILQHQQASVVGGGGIVAEKCCWRAYNKQSDEWTKLQVLM